MEIYDILNKDENKKTNKSNNTTNFSSSLNSNNSNNNYSNNLFQDKMNSRAKNILRTLDQSKRKEINIKYDY